METLVIIGLERTGTNYLCSLLNQLPQVEARFELFANVAAISLTPAEIQLIAHTANQTFQDKSDPVLIRYLKQNISTVLPLIQNQLSSNRDLFSFKIFRDHLPNSVITELIQTSRVMFVTRRVIDTYISFMKALQSEIWINQDTTHLKPVLDINHFVYWYHESLNYYTFCAREYLHWKQELPVVLRYINFTQGSNLENLRFVAQEVRRATNIQQLRIPQVEFKSGFNKQDQNNQVEHKIANWEEFEQQLKDRHLFRKAFGVFLLP